MQQIAIYLWPRESVYTTFGEIAPYFELILQERGHDTVITKTLMPGRLHVVFGANNAPYDTSVTIPEKSIIVNFEQLFDGSPWATHSYINLLKKHTVWDYDQSNIDYLKSRGIIDVHRVVYGYSPRMMFEPNPRLQQDLDVLFIGSITGRREKVLNQIREELLTLKPDIKIQFVGAWGRWREIYILRSKIVLNIHAFESGSRFEITRVLPIAYNKRLVVSEGNDKYEWASTIPCRPIEEIPATIVHLLSDDERRRQLEEASYNKAISQAMTLPLITTSSL